MKKTLTIISAIIALNCSAAWAGEWKIIPQKSKIEFQALQNDSKVSGSFEKFSGKIDFDPAQLKTSKVEIEIDTASLKCSLSDCISTLQTAEWLSVKTFPKATFSADKFTKISDKKFSANGKLTIKNKSVPAAIEFVLEEYSQSNARAVGSAKVKRSDFAIGAKDPANAHGVKDEVIVNFTINATK